MIRMAVVMSEGELVVLGQDDGQGGMVPVVYQHTCELDGAPCKDHVQKVAGLIGVAKSLRETGLEDVRVIFLEEREPEKWENAWKEQIEEFGLIVKENI